MWSFTNNFLDLRWIHRAYFVQSGIRYYCEIRFWARYAFRRCLGELAGAQNSTEMYCAWVNKQIRKISCSGVTNPTCLDSRRRGTVTYFNISNLVGCLQSKTKGGIILDVSLSWLWCSHNRNTKLTKRDFTCHLPTGLRLFRRTTIIPKIVETLKVVI